MSSLLEVTPADIAALSDSDLRELIGRLCEADYRKANLPTSGITWGGHQDAPDGGLDVVVWGNESPPQTSFVPRSHTGFQVKKPDMTPSAVRTEMCPNGVLRDAIKDLIEANGAYIIACSSGSMTGPALQRRINAMRQAVSGEENNENVQLDFLDRGRIATWSSIYITREQALPLICTLVAAPGL